MIKKEEVKHIAKLARLGISQKEEEKFQKDLSSILDYINSLKEVDVSGIEPTSHPSESFLDSKENLMREDKELPETEGRVNKLITASPDQDKRHIKVRAVF